MDIDKGGSPPTLETPLSFGFIERWKFLTRAVGAL
jgi:hypothetical protein